jgi:uncharacterized membrane protein
MTERLGFNDALLMMALVGIAAFALGTALADSKDYSEELKTRTGLKTTGTLLGHLGMAVTGTAIVLAAIRAEGHSTAIRAIMLVLGLAVIFKMFTIGFSGGLST